MVDFEELEEALEGDVGRSFKFEGKEYWAKESEPLSEELFFDMYFKIKDASYKPDYTYLFPSQVSSFNLLQGISEA